MGSWKKARAARTLFEWVLVCGGRREEERFPVPLNDDLCFPPRPRAPAQSRGPRTLSLWLLGSVRISIEMNKVKEECFMGY